MRVAQSKLHPPQLGRPVIDRTWLFERPVSAAGRDPFDGTTPGEQRTSVPVTLISAPAGAGKTTLMARWAEDRAQHGNRVGWLSLAEPDNDRAVFWTGVLTAAETAVAETGGDGGAWLDRDEPGS